MRAGSCLFWLENGISGSGTRIPRPKTIENGVRLRFVLDSLKAKGRNYRVVSTLCPRTGSQMQSL